MLTSVTGKRDWGGDNLIYGIKGVFGTVQFYNTPPFAYIYRIIRLNQVLEKHVLWRILFSNITSILVLAPPSQSMLLTGWPPTPPPHPFPPSVTFLVVPDFLTYTDMSDYLIPFLLFPPSKLCTCYDMNLPVRYDLDGDLCMIRSCRACLVRYQSQSHYYD